MIRSSLAILALCLAVAASAQPPHEYAREDPTKIRTAEACGECHVSEYEVWKRTPHATGFKTLHRQENAEEIAGRMGFPLMKRNSPCLQCHYTPTVQGEQLRAVSGVSCESCHGAGADWIDVHNDYGGKGIDHTNEPAEHRTQRIARSLEAGMRRPSDLYDVASSCYGCHTVPEERLINVGRHSIGSAGFELVEWSQGDIRHNFLDSFKDGDGTDNAERSAERKRLMYVIGRILDLEHGLRGAAEATEKGVYFKAMQRRIRGALTEVRAIGTQSEIPEIDEIVTTVRGTGVALGRRAELLAAADRIGDAARRFLDGRDGTRLAKLDPLVLGTAEVELADFEDDFEEEDEDTVVASGAVGPSETAPPTGTTTAGTTAAGTSAGTQAATVASDAIPAEGDKRSRLRPKSKHATVSATTCQKCHGEENAWWFDDPHYAAIEPFFERDRKNLQIARFYGIPASRLARGDSLCMDCHGTIVTGREKREVEDGVSCQSCHGAAKDFLEPHQEGDPSQGLGRPGYVNALGLGMNELKKLDVRAAACTGCHYVTDPRLISSGHPSGRDFDYVSGMQDIRHWQSPPIAAADLQSAFQTALAARGAVPQVRLARAATTAGGGGGVVTAAADPGALSGDGSVFRPETPKPRPAPSTGRRPAGRSTAGRPTADAPTSSAAIGLPPFPEIDESTRVEDVLLLLKERLELLYRAVQKEP